MGEQCGSVADFAKGTTDKVANLSQNPQSSHSPTANLRILEADNRGESEKALSPSLRGIAEAIHKKQADSSMDCHADKSARNDRKAMDCYARYDDKGVDFVIAPPLFLKDSYFYVCAMAYVR